MCGLAHQPAAGLATTDPDNLGLVSVQLQPDEIHQRVDVGLSSPKIYEHHWHPPQTRSLC